MSRDHDARAKLAKLANSLIQDIMEMSDSEIVAEVGKDGIERARALFGAAKQKTSRQRLLRAQGELEKWRATESERFKSFDLAEARARFSKIRSGDTEFDRKMTIAARNGETPTNVDVDGLVEDWVDLHRLDGQDEPE